MWEGEDEAAVADLTPKQRLLGWIQNKIPQLPVTNFSRDWQDGRALGALVDGCAPGIFSIVLIIILIGFIILNCKGNRRFKLYYLSGFNIIIIMYLIFLIRSVSRMGSVGPD